MYEGPFRPGINNGAALLSPCCEGHKKDPSSSSSLLRALPPWQIVPEGPFIYSPPVDVWQRLRVGESACVSTDFEHRHP